MQRITGDLRQLQGDANTAMSCQHRFWGAEGTQGAHRGHTDTSCWSRGTPLPLFVQLLLHRGFARLCCFLPIAQLPARSRCGRALHPQPFFQRQLSFIWTRERRTPEPGSLSRRFVPRSRRQAARPQRCRPSAPARQRETTPPRRTPRLLALEALPSLRAAPRPLLSAPPAPCPSATALCRTLRTDAIPAAQRSFPRSDAATDAVPHLPPPGPSPPPRRGSPHGAPPPASWPPAPPPAQKRRTRSQTEGNAERAFIGGGAARRARAPCATRKLPARRPGDRPAPGRRPAAAGRRSGPLSRAGPRCRRRAATGCRPGRGAVRPAG